MNIRYKIIEDAILNLEVVICRELDVDLNHPLIRIHTEHMKNELVDMQENDNKKMVDDLKAWQDGSLVNTDAINKMSLADLEKVSEMLEGVK
jgi:hypothetical protein